MEIETERPLFEPELPFKLVGGDPSLDLVNTVDWAEAGLIRDRFAEYGRVLEWAVDAGVIGESVAARLRRLAVERPAAAARALERWRAFRRVLHRCVVAFASGTGIVPALRQLDPYLHEALEHLVLEPGRGAEARVGWSGVKESLDGPMWPVAWRALQLFTSPEAELLRVCGGEDCGWVYVDRSRNGLRRWCEMETCGTTAKNRRRGRQPRARRG